MKLKSLKLTNVVKFTDFELLDEDNQAKLIDTLIADGFQIITAQVGKRSDKENVLLLRECKVVDEYKEENEKEKTTLL